MTQVGTLGVTALAGGSYVVSSQFWDNGTVSGCGCGDVWPCPRRRQRRCLGHQQPGRIHGERLELAIFGVTALEGGSYVVRSQFWDNGAASDAGAVTFGPAQGGVSGVVSATNSLVGSTAGDEVGSSGVTALEGGSYVVSSPFWDNGAASEAGALTFGPAQGGVSGVVSATNSLVGSSVDDQVGEFGVTALEGGSYVVRSPFWDNGGVSDAGAVTFGPSDGSLAGTIDATNSILGAHEQHRSSTRGRGQGQSGLLRPVP